MPRPDPAGFKTWAEYRWADKQWKRKHGGSLIGNVAVAAVAGGITGSQVAVVAFIALAVLVTLARRHSTTGGE
jgi:TRAP-type C4-dicarboxylate transport system permease large subunit